MKAGRDERAPHGQGADDGEGEHEDERDAKSARGHVLRMLRGARTRSQRRALREKNGGPREALAEAAVCGCIPRCQPRRATHQGVISRITGLSSTDTATLLLGVTVVPVALTSGW